MKFKLPAPNMSHFAFYIEFSYTFNVALENYREQNNLLSGGVPLADCSVVTCVTICIMVS